MEKNPNRTNKEINIFTGNGYTKTKQKPTSTRKKQPNKIKNGK